MPDDRQSLRAETKVQAVIFVAIVLASISAVPQFYDRRWDDKVWLSAIVVFIVLPLLAGFFQTQPSRSLTFAIGILLSLCPLVFAVTDRLPQHFEKLRDSHFLATGATIIFMSAAWLAYSFRNRKWVVLAVAALTVLLASVTVCGLLWLIFYME